MKKWKQSFILSTIMHLIVFLMFNVNGVVIFSVGFWVGLIALVNILEDKLEDLK